MAGGLARMGWGAGPVPARSLAGMHGALMVNGFLGTLITLERAVGAGRPWALAAPVLAALSGVLSLWPRGQPLAPAAAWGAGLVATAVLGALWRRHRQLPVLWLAAAAGAWTAGNGLWAAGLPLARVVGWWVAFLVVTIAAERLELARIARPSPKARRTLTLALAVLAGGLVASSWGATWGLRVSGAAWAALGLWLARYDVAWRSRRLGGFARYSAAALLLGYGWLVAGAGLWMAAASRWGAGPLYDAMLHALLLGFVMSMIFAHAPILLPALTGVAVPFVRGFYLPLAALHASTAWRVVADLMAAWGPAAPAGAAMRPWSGLANVAAVLTFGAVLLRAVRLQGHTAGQASRPLSTPGQPAGSGAVPAGTPAPPSGRTGFPPLPG
ncbi:MAG TPA: hypothetical protein VIL11_08200 [Limnochordales bacterium]